MIRLAVLTSAFLVPVLIARQGRDYKMFAAEVMAIAVLFLLASDRRPGPRPSWRAFRPFMPAIAWIACLLAAAANSRHASAADEMVRQAFFFSFFPVSALYLRKDDGNRLAWIWMAAFLFVGGYAMVQRLGLEPVADFRKWNPQDRVFATFGNPDFLGAFTAFLLPLFSSRISGSRRRSPWIISTVLACVVLYWTFSRGAWLGALAGMAVWALSAFGRQAFLRFLPRILAGTVAAVLALSLAGLFPWNTFTRHTDRALLWQGTFRMISAKPVTGWGLGAFPSEFPAFAPPDFNERMKTNNTFAEHPHCEYLHVAVECGLAGSGIFLWLVASMARRFLYFLRSPGGRSLAGPLGALTAILVHISVDRNFRLASTAVPFWIVSGMLLAYGRTQNSPAPGLVPRLGVFRTLLACLLSFLAVAAVFRPLSASLRVEGDKDFLDQRTDIPLSELESQRATRSNDPVWLVTIGNAYAQEKQFDQASKSFQEALKLDPRNVSAANNLGNSYFMMSRFDEAIRAYETALAIDPGHKDARFNMAFAWFHKRDIKRALLECDKLLKMDPTYFKAVQLKSQLSP